MWKMSWIRWQLPFCQLFVAHLYLNIQELFLLGCIMFKMPFIIALVSFILSCYVLHNIEIGKELINCFEIIL